MKERLLYIDNLKGFAILLVVLGHCIQFRIPDYDDHLLFRFIYSFHMPLFFIISGYVSYKADIQIQSLVAKRARQLLFPYFIWGLGEILGLEDLYVIEMYTSVDKFLWFLWVLFFINIITVAVDKLLGQFNRSYVSVIVLLCTGVVLMGVSKSLNLNILGVKLICYHAHFFIAGYVIRKMTFEYRMCFWHLWIALPLYLLLLPFWHRTEILAFGTPLKTMFSLAYKIVVAYLGCYSIYLLFWRYFNNHSFLTKLGTSTLGIYAIHFWVLFFIPDEVPVFMTFIILSVFSYLMVLLLRKSNYLRPLIGEI